MTGEPWRWAGPEAPPFTPQQFVRLGRLEQALKLSNPGDPQEAAAMTEPVYWYGVPCEPWEIAEADQVLAELGIDPAAADFGLSWDAPPAPRDGLDLSNPGDVDFVRGLAAAVSEIPGMAGQAAELYGWLGGADPDAERALDFSGATFDDFIDLTNAQFDRAGAVQADNAVPVPSRTEARLAYLLGRLGRGTYEPSSITLASPSTAARELARHRWQATQPGPVTHQPNCGASDEFGHCIEPYHSAGCGSVASTDVAEALRDSGAYARLAADPFTDQPGRVWDDQHGQPMTLRGHVEASIGQRLGDGAAFETGTGPRELTTPKPWPMLRDPDDPDDPGQPLPDVSRYAAAMGITAPSAAAERSRFAARRAQAISDAVLRGGGRVHADRGETVRERNERLHQPVQPRQVGDTWNGSLPAYEAG